MKQTIVYLIAILLTGCVGLQTPRETNIAVSALLDELQIAINEIDKNTNKSSLPPFKNATVKLSTKAGKTTEGTASLVLSAEGSKTTTDSNTITLELIPNPEPVEIYRRSTGHEIAEYVIAAVSAIDDKKYLKLKSLTVEAGLQVIQTTGGGLDVELIGVTVKARQTGEVSTGHSLKLVFAYPAKKNLK